MPVAAFVLLPAPAAAAVRIETVGVGDPLLAGLALVFLAVVLFVAEVKIVSYGTLTVGGAVSLVLGALLLAQGLGPGFGIDPLQLAAVVALAVAGAGFLTWRAVAMRRLPVRSGREGLVGERGRAWSRLAPQGKVFVHGEYWEAVAAQPIGAGEEIEVTAIEGLRLVVRPSQAA